MINFEKVDTNTKMEIILIWLEYLAKKESLSYRDKEVISNVAEYLVEEALK